MKRILKVKKVVEIKDGAHTGIIRKIRWRSKPYNYVDLEIAFLYNSENMIIKAGFPAIVSKNTKLGQLLIRFGIKLHENEDIDINNILLDKIVSFETFTEITEKGSFAKIKVDSIVHKGAFA